MLDYVTDEQALAIVAAVQRGELPAPDDADRLYAWVAQRCRVHSAANPTRDYKLREGFSLFRPPVEATKFTPQVEAYIRRINRFESREWPRYRKTKTRPQEGTLEAALYSAFATGRIPRSVQQMSDILKQKPCSGAG